MAKLKLAEYRGCSGLPIDTAAWKRAIPYLPGEIDYDQPARQMIRLTPETAKYLYSEYTPLETHYEPGTRPKLERFVEMVASKRKTDREKALAVLKWTYRRASFPGRFRQDLRVVGGTEEDLIERGFTYCNEISRVFVTLCQIAGVPARMTFHWTTCGRFGHSLAEAHFDGKWQLCDTEINVTGSSVRGIKANCWDLMRKKTVQNAFDRTVTRQQLNHLGLTDPEMHYSDCFKLVGICNYPVEKFPYKTRAAHSASPYI